MQSRRGFHGILPAMAVPFLENNAVDEPQLRGFATWLSGHRGIGGLVTNGHTGEVFSLTPVERAEVTRIVADEVGDRIPVISGVCCESITEAAEHAVMAREAGAKGLLVMPPHYWLRFGMEPGHVLEYFSAVGAAAQIDLVVHVYPAWTRASYSSALLAELARLKWVTTFKIGTREMSKYDRDIEAIRTANPGCTILTCHDEYLLATMVQGVDGALVGFASLIPDLIVDLYDAVCAGDLKKAQTIQSRIYVMKEAVYGRGEPTATAHARLKTALMLAGRFTCNRMRPPVKAPSEKDKAAISSALIAAGLPTVTLERYSAQY